MASVTSLREHMVEEVAEAGDHQTIEFGDPGSLG
jgi:hypothetical protein